MKETIAKPSKTGSESLSGVDQKPRVWAPLVTATLPFLLALRPSQNSIVILASICLDHGLL